MNEDVAVSRAKIVPLTRLVIKRSRLVSELSPERAQATVKNHLCQTTELMIGGDCSKNNRSRELKFDATIHGSPQLGGAKLEILIIARGLSGLASVQSNAVTFSKYFTKNRSSRIQTRTQLYLNSKTPNTFVGSGQDSLVHLERAPLTELTWIGQLYIS